MLQHATLRQILCVNIAGCSLHPCGRLCQWTSHKKGWTTETCTEKLLWYSHGYLWEEPQKWEGFLLVNCGKGKRMAGNTQEWLLILQ